MAKRKSYIQETIVDRLRSDPGYLAWWEGLLNSPEYQAVQIFVALDVTKMKTEKVKRGDPTPSHWRAIKKPEFERLYCEGKLNEVEVKIPDGMKTARIIHDVQLSSFFDPTSGREGTIRITAVAMKISSDRSKNISPHENPALPEFMTRKAKNQFTNLYRKSVLQMDDIKDDAPSDAPLDPGSSRAKFNKMKAEYIKAMKRVLKGNENSKYLSCTDPRVKDIFKGVAPDRLPKQKTLQNWASQARKKTPKK